MLRVRLLLAGFVAFTFATSLTRAELVWRPGEGWSDESGGDVSASSSRDQLDLAHKLEAQGQRDSALKAYRALLRRWPLSFFAPEAQYRVGKILEDQGDFYNAFQAFQKMVTKYPSSDYFSQALNEQYRIANLFLAGEPQRIWKIPVGPSMQRTIEMYNRIIKNAPYGDYAPQCQFNIGIADEKQRKFTDAVDAYQLVLDNYPTSSVAANAQYQIGYAWMKSSISGDYDMGAARKAVDAFQDYLVRYPNSDKAVQAQENIRRLSQKQTQGAFDIAKFYETQHQTRAAFIYYNEVLREDPTSDQAAQAKKRIADLRPLVEAMPGGLGPDGSGNPALPLQPKIPGAPGAPNDGGPLPPGTPGAAQPDAPLPADTPETNSAPQAPANGSLPADPNAPVTSSSPGETAADDSTNAATAVPVSSATTNAPSAQPPANKTPASQ
ncbi:MAG TPA: outer membrane protein assembly factor BamD [Candidatus Methylacidiphilales bacterium]|jgi:outer membrane protein assembly factor BamD|nr:outer membrane protein assembly factor BamD [Candidatus Methylacidiphilales bacterium]